MTKTHSEVVEGSLNSIIDGVQKYPNFDGDTPESLGWEAFLAKHPNYSRFEFGTAIIIAQQGRELLEDLGGKYTTLGGAVMRRHLNDELIMEIAGK